MNEAAYIRGKNASLIRLLGIILKELGPEVPELGEVSRLRLERAETVEKLRTVCERFGDLAWEDSLHLGDVIEKHLANRLQERANERYEESVRRGNKYGSLRKWARASFRDAPGTWSDGMRAAQKDVMGILCGLPVDAHPKDRVEAADRQNKAAAPDAKLKPQDWALDAARAVSAEVYNIRGGRGSSLIYAFAWALEAASQNALDRAQEAARVEKAPHG